MAIELERAGLSFEREKEHTIYYDGKEVLIKEVNNFEEADNANINIKRTSTVSIVQKAFAFFENNNISST